MSWRRRIGSIVLVLGAVLVAGPYLLPLPTSPDEDPESHARPDGRFVEVAGTRTYVEESGPPGGPAVVLLHGFGGSTYSWVGTRAALAESGYRAIAVDLRGFGLSDKDAGDHAHPAQAAMVDAVMDRLRIDEAVVVGHSMGGNVAAHLALGFPNRVRALVLVDAALVPPGEDGASEARGIPVPWLLDVPPVRRAARIAMRLVLNPDNVESLLRSAYADPAFPSAEVAAAYLVPQRLPDWDLALLAIVRDSGRNVLPGTLAALGRVPVLVAWGDADPWIPVARGATIADAIPGARWLIVQAGHLPMEEGADAFEAGLIDFLERLP
jgi:pimeloyl-ACP methyl ester carboxylesterase